jgi:hypothetical protein
LIDLINDPLAHTNHYYDPQYSRVIAELEERLTTRTADQRVPVQFGGNPFHDGE